MEPAFDSIFWYNDELLSALLENNDISDSSLLSSQPRDSHEHIHDNTQSLKRRKIQIEEKSTDVPDENSKKYDVTNDTPYLNNDNVIEQSLCSSVTFLDSFSIHMIEVYNSYDNKLFGSFMSTYSHTESVFKLAKLQQDQEFNQYDLKQFIKESASISKSFCGLKLIHHKRVMKPYPKNPQYSCLSFRFSMKFSSTISNFMKFINSNRGKLEKITDAMEHDKLSEKIKNEFMMLEKILKASDQLVYFAIKCQGHIVIDNSLRKVVSITIMPRVSHFNVLTGSNVSTSSSSSSSSSHTFHSSIDGFPQPSPTGVAAQEYDPQDQFAAIMNKFGVKYTFGVPYQNKRKPT